MFFTLFAHLLTGGVSPMHDLRMRIINGMDACIGKFPFMATFHHYPQYCGCVFLNTRWLLTAAHCIGGSKPESVVIRYGTNEIKTNKYKAQPKRFIIHPKYSANKDFDLGLIELDKAIEFNYKNIAPIKLPENNFELPQDRNKRIAVAVGWGRKELSRCQDTYGTASRILQQVTLMVFTDDECKRKMYKNDVTNIVCAGVEGGVKGTCMGDSGGPLIYQGNILIGITSRVFIPCGTRPGIYIKVSKHVDWIKENMK